MTFNNKKYKNCINREKCIDGYDFGDLLCNQCPDFKYDKLCKFINDYHMNNIYFIVFLFLMLIFVTSPIILLNSDTKLDIPIKYKQKYDYKNDELYEYYETLRMYFECDYKFFEKYAKLKESYKDNLEALEEIENIKNKYLEKRRKNKNV